MSDTKNIAIQRAIALLNAAGARYAIVTDTGEKFGELEVAVPKAILRKRSGIDFKAIYGPVLEAMQPGDCQRICPPPGVDPEMLRSAVTAACANTWGKGNYISTVDKATGEMELLRVA